MDRRRIFVDGVPRWDHVTPPSPWPVGPVPNLDIFRKDRDGTKACIEISMPSDPILLVPRCPHVVTLLSRVMRPTHLGLFGGDPIRGI